MQWKLCFAQRLNRLGSCYKRQNRVARIHQRVTRHREDFHYKIAYKLVRQYDLIAVEELNIQGLAKTRLAKSIYDVAWGKFLTILEAVAVKCGVWFVKVSPHGTTGNCSQCGTKVPKTLSVRLHECTKCGLTLDRDENAAINILMKALQALGLIASECGGLSQKAPDEAVSSSRRKRSPHRTR